MDLRISKKLLRRLGHVRMETDSSCGMYPGSHYDSASAQHSKLERMGLIEPFIPHNLVHKERVTITDKGRTVLEENGIKER